MTRKLGLVLLALCVTTCASAAVNPGTISGIVRNSSGVPQMGAVVELLAVNNSAQSLTVYTDNKGQFFAKGLLPGNYTIKVTAPSFLPTIRDRVGLSSGASIVINVTLNTLFEAIQLVPKRPQSAEDQDDWRWTLRSVANRPILRLADSGPLVVVRDNDDENDGVLKAKVSFMAGSLGETFGGADMSTNFEVEQSLFSTGKLGVTGNVGYGAGMPAVFRASYSHDSPTGNRHEIAFTGKRFASPELASRHAALQALAMSVSESTQFGRVVELNYGGELQSIQFVSRATAFRPYASADVHVGQNTMVGYRYSTSLPTMRKAKGYDTAPADLSESGPRFSMLDNRLAVERSAHHEVSVSHRRGKNSVQVAAYRDRVRNTALTGAGLPEDADIVPDVYSSTFLVNGGEYSTNGMRVVYERKVAENMYATVDYSYGGVLNAPENLKQLSDVRANLRTVKRHSVAAKFNGTLPAAKTKILASYKWVNDDALTTVDMFNASPGQADPYLNVFVRQPLPKRWVPAGMEALVDVRNLLAQGYRPVISNDGSSVYLVQVARSVRGGVAFTF